MARITIEDCLEHVPNRFALVLMSAERTKQLVRGSEPLVHDHRDNKEIVTSLREIAAQKVQYVEKQVQEFDPASEAEIRRAAQIRAIPEGKEPKIEARVATTEGDFEDELDDADLDEEFAEETDLDKLFSKLDSSGEEVDDDEDEDEDDDDVVDDDDDVDDDAGSADDDAFDDDFDDTDDLDEAEEDEDEADEEEAEEDD